MVRLRQKDTVANRDSSMIANMDKLTSSLRAPDEFKEVRVLVLEVGDPTEYGAGGVLANPWYDSGKLPRQPTAGNVDDLVSYGMPLSLVSALRQRLPPDVQIDVLRYLQAIVSLSAKACDMLNRTNVLPLALAASSCKECTRHATEIERFCKARLHEMEYSRAASDWTGWVCSYEVWLCFKGVHVAKVQGRGMSKTAACFDFGGIHLTGGRLWAGGLMLMRWCCALIKSSPHVLGSGPILEIGAGIGLVGVAVAKLGMKVVVSDREPALLQRMRENVEAEGVEDMCKVLPLDWSKAGDPKQKRILAAQRFSAVIGADVVYEEEHTELVAHVLQHALPSGGVGLFVGGKWHRRGAQVFGSNLRKAGFEVTEGIIPCGEEIQQLVCGAQEPSQEYCALMVTVPPASAILATSTH
mmetsp:Transcript_25908/g.72300  ORF Transcript_25908/g.72300 Transcript_25908/m.72300 type:complete len:412 (-) Transcript_25908:102-1337(-)